MKKILIYIALLIFALVSNIRCSDFLDLDPTATVPNELAFETLEDCEKGVNGMYNGVRALFIQANVMRMEATADDIKYNRWGTNNYMALRTWTWSSGQAEIQSYWSIYYNTIARINNTLAGIEKFEETNQTRQWRAELLFGRALFHYNLMELFAPRYNSSTAATDLAVPVVLETNLYDKPRNTVAEVITQIERDLTDAESLFNDNRGKEYFSIVTLQAFKSRYYLYTQQYDRVVTAAAAVESLGYSLTNATDFYNMWKEDVSDEIIWLVVATPSEAGNQDWSTLGDQLIGDSQGLPVPNFLPASELLALYDKNNDFRYNAYFKDDVTLRDNATTIPQTLVFKYPGKSGYTYRISQAKYFRYGEVLMNKIEALYYTNPTEANNELNRLRRNRITGYVDMNYTGTALLDAIKVERRKELAIEGRRWFDLKRWNQSMVRTLDEFTYAADEIDIRPDNYHWLFPIPQHEINANTQIKDQQNPGYY